MTYPHWNISPQSTLGNWLIGTGLGVCFIGVAGVLLFFQKYEEKIFPGVQAGQDATIVDLGGLTKAEAIRVLGEMYAVDQNTEITFTYDAPETNSSSAATEPMGKSADAAKSKDAAKSNQITTNFGAIGVQYEIDKTVEKAFRAGREKTGIAQVLRVIQLQLAPKTIPVSLKIDSHLFSEVVTTPVEQAIYVEPATPSAKLRSSGNAETIEIAAGTNGQFFDGQIAQETVLQTVAEHNRDQTDQAGSISLYSAIKESGFVLSEEQVGAARSRAARYLNKSIPFSHTVYLNPTEQPENNTIVQVIEKKLNDQDLISLLSFENLVSSATHTSSLEPSQPSPIREDLLSTLLSSWESEIATPVQEPELEIDSESKKVIKFTPPQNGITIDKEKIRTHILEEMNRIESSTNLAQVDQPTESPTFPLPLSFVSPQKSLGELNTLGIKELIGQGDSKYAGSIPNRAFNVNLTATRINNTLVAPGEEFSFNRTLGDISAATGFRSAYVIKNGRTELGDGGGVCQVSTTVFRAVLNAGLDVTRRLQHSYRVGYYEQNAKPGLDATVYSGEVDFRFINDTNHYILIHNIVDTEKMTMKTQIFGTNDGRSTEIITHETWGATGAPAPQFFPDPSLPAGRRVQIDWAVGGIKSRVVNKITYPDGTIKEDEYYSNYRPWSAKYRVGV